MCEALILFNRQRQDFCDVRGQVEAADFWYGTPMIRRGYQEHGAQCSHGTECIHDPS